MCEGLPSKQATVHIRLHQSSYVLCLYTWPYIALYNTHMKVQSAEAPRLFRVVPGRIGADDWNSLSLSLSLSLSIPVFLRPSLSRRLCSASASVAAVDAWRRVVRNDGFSGRCTTRAEDAQEISNQSHISPSILVHEGNIERLGSAAAVDLQRMCHVFVLQL